MRQEAEGQPNPPWSAVEIDEHLAYLAKAVARPQNTAQDWLDLHEEVGPSADMRSATPQQRERFSAFAAVIVSKQSADPE